MSYDTIMKIFFYLVSSMLIGAGMVCLILKLPNSAEDVISLLILVGLGSLLLLFSPIGPWNIFMDTKPDKIPNSEVVA